jgi:DNA-directed RNA polymerase specialized sigma24 family protein
MPTSRCDEADAWLRPHRAPLIGFVLPLVNGDLQAAEDVVQETMLRGWQHAAELKPEQAGSWLHTVARNIASLQVTTADRNLVTISVHHPTAQAGRE